MKYFSRYRRDNAQAKDHHDEVLPVPEDGSREIVPLPDTESATPPVNIDEREDVPATDTTIELPGQDEPTETTSDQFENEIDEHLPLPTTDEYHDDDTQADDPYDVDDQVDMTMPVPTREPDTEVDDASTSEEFDVNTVPGKPNDWDISKDPARVENGGTTVQESTPVYVGGPSDDDPDHNESDFSPLSYDDDEASSKSRPDPEEMSSERSEPQSAPLHAVSGTTTCPVCGRETDALHFCGHCGSPLTDVRPERSASSFSGRLRERVQHLLEPVAQSTRPGGVRFILAAGGILALLALLANNGALALMIGAAILPLILIFWCVHQDVFEREPIWLLAAFGLAGTVVGAILGWIGSLIVAGTWFDEGVLNYGAAGLGGDFAERAGSPPFLTWSLVGIVFPLLALVAIIGAPVAMRQNVSLGNEEMDGLTLGAIMGAGVSVGTAIVFAAPMLTHSGPVSDASTWTLTVIGLTIIRPLVWTLCGGLLGAATWRYMVSGSLTGALLPAFVGAAGVLVFTFMSIELSTAGLWTEFTWGIFVALVVSFFYKRTMNQAVIHDRQILGQDNSRVICPHCHQVTPAGQYCAHCGEDIAPVKA